MFKQIKQIRNPYDFSLYNNCNFTAEISKQLVDLSFYANKNIPNYSEIVAIPKENLNYLNNDLHAYEMEYMFAGCHELTIIPKLNIDTSKVTKMNSMFSFCKKITTLDLFNFNTSRVLNMEEMFIGCTLLTTLDLSNFNTNIVKNMHSMFEHCNNLQTLDLSSFNTGKVNDMSNMFGYCRNLTTIIGVIDMKLCIGCTDMFYKCSNLKGVKIKNPPPDFESATGLRSDRYKIVT